MLLTTNIQKSSVNSYLRPLKTIFNYLVENEIIEDNPFGKIKLLKTQKKLVSYLSEDEINIMIKSCDIARTSPTDKLILVLFLTTGIRREELINIKISDICGQHVTINGKNNKQRKLILQPEIFKLLESYIPYRLKKYGVLHPELFISKYGTKFTGDGISKKIKRIMKESGFSAERISQIHTHSLRHTFVANLFESGADIYTAQKALGHELLKTTEIYAHLRNSALDRSILNMKPLSI
jgi:integrase/recombinase XerC